MTKLFLFLLIFQLSFSQTTIKGTVFSQEKAVPFVNVIVKEMGTQNIVAFSKTNIEGKFTVKTNLNAQNCYVEFTALNLAKQQLFLKDLNVNDLLNLKIELFEKITEIQEVIIKQDKAVVVKNDTTFYNINKFKDGSEKTVEDLLKKLPGIQVAENGTIKFNGKEIEHVLLDGKDIFSNEYKLGTRNIDVNMIDKIQGIENYEKTSILKGLTDNENKAINLVLKADRTSLSNRFTAGYGYKNVLESEWVSTVVNKKITSFLVSNYNNVGVDKTTLNENSLSIEKDGDLPQNYFIAKSLSAGSLFSGLNDSYHKLNNSFNNNLRFLLPVFKKSELKLFGMYSTDKITRENFSETNIFSSDLNIIESNRIVKKPKVINLEFKFLNKENKNFNWEYTNKFYWNNANDVNLVNNNNNILNSYLNSKNYYTKQNLDFIYRKNDNAFEFKFLFLKNSLNQNLTFVNSDVSLQNSRQLLNINKTVFNFQSNYFTKINNYKIFIGFDYLNSKNNLFSNNERFLANQFFSLGNNFLNNNLLSTNNLSVTTKLVYDIKKFKFSAKLTSVLQNLKFEELSLNDNFNKFILNPDLRFVFKPSKKSVLSFLYNYNAVLPTENNLYTSKIQSSYRSFENNVVSLQNLNAHAFNFGYSYTNNNLFTNFNVNSFYSFNRNGYLSKYQFDQFSSSSTTFYSDLEQKNYGFTIAGKTYSHFIRTTIEPDFNYSISESYNLIDTNNFRTLKSNTITFQFNLKTVISQKLIFYMKPFYSNNQFYVNNEFTSEFSNFNNQFKFYYGGFSDFKFNVSLNTIYPNLKQSDNFWFLEGEFTYKPKKSGISYELLLKNMTNNQVYKIVSISDFSSNTFQHNLINRYILLKVSFAL